MLGQGQVVFGLAEVRELLSWNVGFLGTLSSYSVAAWPSFRRTHSSRCWTVSTPSRRQPSTFPVIFSSAHPDEIFFFFLLFPLHFATYL